ncbi:hypothetical protein BDW67DRAFT_177816 [Aspergillus spinulosporus]
MAADERFSITAVSWTLGILSILLVALRLYTRLLITRCRGWDDLFVTIALVNAIICSSLTQIAVSHGLGKHETDILDPNDRVKAAKYTIIAPNFSVVSTVTGKISVVIFLLRLLTLSAKPWQRWFLYSLTLASIAWNILGIVAIIGYCRPTRKIWLPETEGSCMSPKFQLVAGISQSAFNAFADCALALFPVILFRKVQLPLLKKVGVVAVLGAGVLAGCVTVFKCFLLDKLIAHDDITWTWRAIMRWYIQLQRPQPKIWNEQMYLIIICASVPTLPQSFNALFHPRQTYHKYNSRSSRCNLSRPDLREPGILLHSMQDSSLFDAAAEHTGSQENILARNEGESNTDIGKMTDVAVAQDSDRGEKGLNRGGAS